MAEVISNVGNKYIFGEETTFGSTPVSITALDLGHVQSITINEAENTEGISSINSLHTAIDLEDGLYNLSGSIVTKCTQASLPVILKAIMGAYAGDTPGEGNYTITTSPVHSDDLSYFMKFNTTTGKIKVMNGICFTGGEISVAKDGDTQITMNFQAQVLLPATATLSVSTNVGDIFKGLDGVVTYNGHDTILGSYTISIDWNIDINDSRGIEPAHANGRRVINRVIRHNLSLSGNFETEMDDYIDTGYLDERTSVPLVLTLSRGTSNSHAFTIAKARTSTRNREMNTDNATKKLTCDFIGTDLAVVGDLFAEVS